MVGFVVVVSFVVVFVVVGFVVVVFVVVVSFVGWVLERERSTRVDLSLFN